MLGGGCWFWCLVLGFRGGAQLGYLGLYVFRFGCLVAASFFFSKGKKMVSFWFSVPVWWCCLLVCGCGLWLLPCVFWVSCFDLARDCGLLRCELAVPRAGLWAGAVVFFFVALQVPLSVVAVWCFAGLGRGFLLGIALVLMVSFLYLVTLLLLFCFCGSPRLSG